MVPYKFVNRDGIPAQAPQTDITSLLQRADGDEPLSRQEKDRIAEVCYGLFGAHGPVYKFAGWAWDIRGAKQIKRFLVKHRWHGWLEYYAPDKTSLRKTLNSTGMRPIEIIAA